MITQNDYALMLFNGDCGIFLPGECRLPTVSKPTLWEPMENYVPSPPHGSPRTEPVYAMTVHKSQGSEFAEILIILPDRPSPLLSRELLYTAITRAREKVTILATEEVLKFTVSRKMERTSGLGLWLREGSGEKGSA